VALLRPSSYSLPFHASAPLNSFSRADCRRSFKKFLGQISRILVAPFQRLPDDFVLVRAREIPQEPLARSLVDKRGKRRPLRTPPGVQLDRKRTMIDALPWALLLTLLLRPGRAALRANAVREGRLGSVSRDRFLKACGQKPLASNLRHPQWLWFSSQSSWPW